LLECECVLTGVDIIGVVGWQQGWWKMAQDYLRVSVAGSKMTRQAADDLEQRVSTNPDDELSRVALMGYYPARAIWHRADREKSLNHELWFIRNYPAHPELRFPRCSAIACADKDLYELGRSAWLEHVHEDCNDVAILSNAAAFFTRWDREFAVQLVERARKIEPANNRLLLDLAHIYYLGLIGTHDDIWLRRAYEVYKELADAEPDSVREVAQFADIALRFGDTNAAKAAARRLLTTHPAAHPQVLYEAHSVLGRIYLQEGDMQAARAELLASGAWPQYDLDNEFIAIGERQVVCEHLWRSLPAWKAGQIQLILWILQLRLGGKPKLSRNWLLSYGIGGYANDGPPF